MSSASDKAKFFAEIFSENSNLNDSGVSLPAFPSGTDPKLYNQVFLAIWKNTKRKQFWRTASCLNQNMISRTIYESKKLCYILT